MDVPNKGSIGNGLFVFFFSFEALITSITPQKILQTQIV
jgi:hypothetical protein